MFEIIVGVYVVICFFLFYIIFAGEREEGDIELRRFLEIILWSCVPGFSFYTLLVFICRIIDKSKIFDTVLFRKK